MCVIGGSEVAWLRVDRGMSGISSSDILRVAPRVVRGHPQSEAEPRKEVARRATTIDRQEVRELRGNLRRRYTLVGSRRVPFFDGTTRAADAIADADHDE